MGFFENQSNKPACGGARLSGNKPVPAEAAFLIQVGEYLLDDHWVLNAGNHFDGAAAFRARFDVDIENPLQSLGPSHRGTAFGGRSVLCLIRHFDLVAFAPLCGRHLRTMRAVRCKHTVTNSSGMNLDSFSWPAKRAGIRDDTSKAGEVNPRFGHQDGWFRFPSHPKHSHPWRNIQARF